MIYYGAHRDDAAGNAYPDCSVPFYDSINTAIYEGSGHALKVEAPFINKDKAQVVTEGLVCMCHMNLHGVVMKAATKPCGKCGTCIDRAKAFAANGVADPAL